MRDKKLGKTTHPVATYARLAPISRSFRTLTLEVPLVRAPVSSSLSSSVLQTTLAPVQLRGRKGLVSSKYVYIQAVKNVGHPTP